MQYANIIVDHKAGFAPFTYSIPPELLAHLSVGSVVLVPVGRQSAHGVITQFVRRLDSSIAVKLKPISSVVYGGEFVPQYVISATNWLHEQYGFGLNELLFSFLPPLLKRKQPDITYQLGKTPGYRSVEYVISAVSRVSVYKKMAKKLLEQNQSLVIICASQSAVSTLAELLKDLPIFKFPDTDTLERKYFIDALSPKKPVVYLGTRKTIITPLTQVGAVVIDEPWLPGHKEERSPRLWSPLAAQALCRARGIPLYLVSSLPWPETRLIDSPRRYTVRSLFGKVCLASRRPMSELITQFLSDYDSPNAKLAVFLRESKKQVFWCPRCKQSAILYDRCAICGGEPIILPALSKELVKEELEMHHPEGSIEIFSSDELLQYKHFDAALVLNFDVYLSVTDFRATAYLVTLLYLIGAQAKETLFVTTHPDEWTHLTQKDVHYFALKELEERQTHHLPPYSLAIQLSAKQKDILTKLLPLELDSILRLGAIKQHGDVYRMSLLIRRGTTLPTEWFKKAYLKVDILPNYID